LVHDIKIDNNNSYKNFNPATAYSRSIAKALERRRPTRLHRDGKRGGLISICNKNILN
jgi:hypothetical protein